MSVSCELLSAVDKAIWLYSLILIAWAVLSWVPDLRGSWARYLDMIVEPVVAPFRRIIPPIGGLDLSLLLVFAVIWLIRAFVLAPAIGRCLFF
jgi:YggT family protein